MMIASPIVEMDQPLDATLRWISQRLAGAGLQVMRTFDLQVARFAHADCVCPQHGSNQCDCQIVVLLVYGPNSQPASLVVHGRGQHARITLVETPGEATDENLESVVRRTLLNQTSSS